MSPNLAIRPYKPGDENAILGLRRAVWGGVDPVRTRFSAWWWQFIDNPAGPGVIRLAWDRETLAAQYAVIPAKMLVDGHPALMAFSCDTMVHPSYRRRGLFTALAKAVYADMAKKGMASVFGFPNPDSMPGFVKNLDWKPVGRFPAHLGPSLLPGRGLGGGFSVKPLEHFSSDFDDLFQKHAPASGVIQVRDAAYLNWRYLGEPRFNYRPFGVFRHGLLAGFFVLRVTRIQRIPVAVILDLFPQSLATPGILSAVRKTAQALRAPLLLSLTPLPGLLRVPNTLAPKSFDLAGKFSPPLSPTTQTPQNWRLSLGDTDIV